MSETRAGEVEVQLRAGVYARLSEKYEQAESVPAQLEHGSAHAERRGWRVAATFKDDGYSGYKEITRDDFVKLIEAIERGEIDVVIVRDVDRLTRNLTDWNRFEKACVRHGVLLSAYTGGDLDLSTPEGAYYGGMETLRARRESAVKSARVREAIDRKARAGKRTGGGPRWFGYVRVYANPDESDRSKRHILREELHPVEADLVKEAVRRVLDYGEPVNGILVDWTERGVKPVSARSWTVTGLRKILVSARIAGLREWQGQKYQASWPAIIDRDTHERLVKHFSDPARKPSAVRRHEHLLGGIPVCPKCGHRMYFRPYKGRSEAYACVTGVGRGCGGCAILAEPLEEYVTGAVLDALESPRVQEALRDGDQDAPQRSELLAEIQRAQDTRAQARRDHAEGIIDREDWLDIRARTEEIIASKRREYDRLSGSATVLGDIPVSDRVRDAWESWNVSRRRAAIKAVLNAVIIKPLPPGVAPNPASRVKDPTERRERYMAVLRQRVEFDWRV